MSVAAEHIQHQNMSTLLVRMQTYEMLIPKSVVVDIVSWSRSKYISERAASNHLHVGKYTWNGEILPLLSLDKITPVTGGDDSTRGKKIVVLKSVFGETQEHYALEVRGLPKPLIINDSTLRAADDDRELFAYNVRIGNRFLYIPDLEQIEQLAISQE